MEINGKHIIPATPHSEDMPSLRAFWEALKRGMTEFIMENQNADQPVKIGIQKIMKEIGMEQLDEEEDYLVRHNLSSSRADTEAHDYLLMHYEPMIEKLKEVQKRIVGNRRSRRAMKQAY